MFPEAIKIELLTKNVCWVWPKSY